MTSTEDDSTGEKSTYGNVTRSVRSWFRRNPKAEHYPQIVDDFTQTFTTAHGRRVLTYFLSQANFFSETTDEEGVVLNNYAKQMLRDIGIWVPGNEKAIVDALLDHVERKR